MGVFLCLLFTIMMYAACFVHGTVISEVNTSYADEFFSLAYSNYNTSKNRFKNSTDYKLNRLQIIRIPKASSTALSIVARRMVGCLPPGPCCKFPGEPPGTCPNELLADCIKEKKVIGCIGHSVDVNFFYNKSIPTISVMREPTSRALSAFFYPGMHHNSECTKDRLECFKLYLTDRRFKNIVVKMLTGEFAYDKKVVTCRSASVCKHSLEKAKENLQFMNFFGGTEMWELSLLLLHYKFKRLIPVYDEFAVSEDVSSAQNNSADVVHTASQSHRIHNNTPTSLEKESTSNSSYQLVTHVNVSHFNVRVNNNDEYKRFKNMAMKDYVQHLKKQNELDLELYQLVLESMCAQLMKYKLWELPLIQNYWKEKIPKNFANRTACRFPIS
jgi:hypothetical protein